MHKSLIYVFFILLMACGSKTQKIKPDVESISESVYASGLLKSKNQYSAFAQANGIIREVFVTEGDSVSIGTPLLAIANQSQKLNKENAELAAGYADFVANEGKLNEARSLIEVNASKLKLDSALYFRQKLLWKQGIGTLVELEQRELAYKSSKSVYQSSLIKYNDLKRQLSFNSAQARKNLSIASNLEQDFIVRSEINGRVYSLSKEKGEMVTSQTPLAIIGDGSHFILEMKIDEFDIVKIKKGLKVLVTLESYKGRVYEARISKINPILNERSKTLDVEAEFITVPPVLYPNISFEANIIIQAKDNVLLIPREYLVNDSFVMKADGKKIPVITGLKDYQKIEIISGLNKGDEIIKPKE